MQLTRHTLRHGALGLLLFPLLAGCGGGGGGSNGNPGTGTTGTPGTTGAPGTTGGNAGGNNGPLTASVVEPDGLTATVTESANTVAVGGSVTYTVTLTNGTAAAVTINADSQTAPSGPPASVLVKDPSGNPLIGGVPPPPNIFSYSLAPGQSLTSSQAISGFTVAGTYSATANFQDATSIIVGPLTVVAH